MPKWKKVQKVDEQLKQNNWIYCPHADNKKLLIKKEWAVQTVSARKLIRLCGTGWRAIYIQKKYVDFWLKLEWQCNKIIKVDLIFTLNFLFVEIFI